MICMGVVLSSCATYTTRYKESTDVQELPKKEIEKTFYLIGDAGNADLNKTTQGLKLLQQVIDTTNTENDYVLFLGDNIYQKGMPDKKADDRKIAEHRIDAQLESIKNFKGDVVFIPGNHDYYTDGVKGVKRQEKYITSKLKKNSFLPKKGCPLESIEVSDQIQLVIIDTQWYLANWDKYPTMNDDCSIKTRAKFFTELEGELKKYAQKTIVIALHHPMFTNGPHGGKFTFDKHIFPAKAKIPLPFLGTLANHIRWQGGVSSQDMSNMRYAALKSRLTTMVRGLEKVVLVSGHEHSLQLLNNDGLYQIVSGSGAKVTGVSLGQDGVFAHAGQGIAVLDVYKDGSSSVKFMGTKEGKPSLLYQQMIFDKKEAYDYTGIPSKFDTTTKASIYDTYHTEKKGLYTWFFGKHYRHIYGTKVTVPVMTLDTLHGGMKIERQGGGQQTRSLILTDKEGKAYSLRAVKKSATQFLQKGAFRNTYLGDNFQNTVTEDLLFDFYTSSFPYGFLTVGTMADAIAVFHPNPKLYYMPKHQALGTFNENFGDELYFLEEKPGDDFGSTASFGKPDDIESTDKVLKNIRKDEKYQVDDESYIRARLFDMLLGDWDRHPDQWRWSRFDKKKKSIYKPIPRDRDQVYSNYDGALVDIVKAVVPLSRKFQVYSGDLKKTKWINLSGIRLDRTFTQRAAADAWKKEAKFIKEKLTDEVIDKAFSELPAEIQNKTTLSIRENLKSRRDQVIDIAEDYYNYLSKHVIITGTDKKDYIEVNKQKDKTVISLSRIKKGKVKKPYYSRVFDPKETKEIWIYGLDDDDQFKIIGKANKNIKIRIVGGQNNDEYIVENGNKLKIYDHQSKPNTIKKRGGAKYIFKDIYSYNLYDYNKSISTSNVFLPFFGFNPDDGFNLNVTNTFVKNGFKNDPFHSKHVLKAGYYFATQGYDISYAGGFANALGNWDITIDGLFRSENFAQNFFGFGNTVINLDEDLGLDYNRVKTSVWSFGLGIAKQSLGGSKLAISANIDGVEVQDTEGRIMDSGLGFVQNDPDFFERKFFGNLDLNYSYKSYDMAANPTRGMLFELESGATTNVENTDKTFGYVNSTLGFYNALSKNRKWVLKTLVSSQLNIGDDFEFYQAANLGGNKGLRGYRNERFSGKSALAVTNDLKYSFNRFKTGIMPLQFSLFAGYDIGRVWVKNVDDEVWNDSYGGGILINAIDTISGQLALFSSDDGMRFSFGLGMSF